MSASWSMHQMVRSCAMEKCLLAAAACKAVHFFWLSAIKNTVNRVKEVSFSMLVVPSGPLIWIFTLLHQEPLDINIVSSVRGPQAAAPPPVFLLRSESCFVALQRDRERETDRQTDTKKRKSFMTLTFPSPQVCSCSSSWLSSSSSSSSSSSLSSSSSSSVRSSYWLEDDQLCPLPSPSSCCWTSSSRSQTKSGRERERARERQTDRQTQTEREKIFYDKLTFPSQVSSCSSSSWLSSSSSSSSFVHSSSWRR